MFMKVKRYIMLALLLCMSVLCGMAGCNKGTVNTVTEEQKTENQGTENQGKEDQEEEKPTDTVGTPEAGEEDTGTEESGNASTEEAGDAIVSTEPMYEKSSLTIALSKESGVYESDFSLDMSCDGEAEIYYTTDGSDPITSPTRMRYEGSIQVTDRQNEENYVSAVDPFLFDGANVRVNSTRDGFVSSRDIIPTSDEVDKCTVIRAVGMDSQGAYTEIVTNTYFVGSMAEHIQGIEESCAAAGTSLAVISISINYEDLFDSKTGIYVKGDIYETALKEYLLTGEKFEAETSRQLDANYKQRGKEWERKVHIDFFESDGATTSLAFAQNCGIRIQGNYSRSDLQKGFRLYAREEYGAKNFEYAVFGEQLKNDMGETITKFKTLTLRNGGNCAFTTKYSDTYWQSLIKELDCETQTSRPCVVYIDGEYWGLYILQEDYTDDYFENTHGVQKDDVVLYKGDAEVYEIGYKLDVGELPEETREEGYYFNDLTEFFQTHKDLTKEEDYQEFTKLVDVESARDYFAVQIWINNKWDWPGKNWSLWKTVNVDEENPYADGRWRFCFYDVEFGGVMGAGDARANTIKEDNYKTYGLLDMDTNNPAVLIYAYLMTSETFRKDFEASLLALSENNFNKVTALAALDEINQIYSPLYEQFFTRYKGAGTPDNAINGGYASYQCIKDFLGLRADYIQPMLDYVNKHYNR